jgi:DNA-binding CsgD family transcriptional regulator
MGKKEALNIVRQRKLIRLPRGTHNRRRELRDDTHLTALGLTPRECEVMRWVSEGKRNREIAVILGLSSRTVEEHVSNIFEKLQVKTRAAAAGKCRHSIVPSATPP